MAASELQKMLAGEMYDPFAHQLRQLGRRHAIFAGSSTRRASRKKPDAGGFSRERRLRGGAIVLAGVRLRSRSVIGVDSVVTRDIPDAVFAGGNPCRVIRPITE